MRADRWEIPGLVALLTSLNATVMTIDSLLTTLNLTTTPKNAILYAYNGENYDPSS